VADNEPVISSHEDGEADSGFVGGKGDVIEDEGFSALKTPRIARREGLSAEPLSPFVPISGRRITHRENEV
jgi:hypothetical protein